MVTRVRASAAIMYPDFERGEGPGPLRRVLPDAFRSVRWPVEPRVPGEA